MTTEVLHSLGFTFVGHSRPVCVTVFVDKTDTQVNHYEIEIGQYFNLRAETPDELKDKLDFIKTGYGRILLNKVIAADRSLTTAKNAFFKKAEHHGEKRN